MESIPTINDLTKEQFKAIKKKLSHCLCDWVNGQRIKCAYCVRAWQHFKIDYYLSALGWNDYVSNLSVPEHKSQAK